MRAKHVLLILVFAAILFTAGFVYQSYREKQAEIEAQEQWTAHMISTVEGNTFYEGLYLDGVSLGGLTMEEARERFAQRAEEQLDKLKVELIYEDESWVFDYKDIGAHIDWEDKLNTLYNQAREGSLEERYKKVEEIEEKGVYMETTLTKDISLIKDEIIAIAESLMIEPVDADIQFFPDRENKFVLTDDKNGQRVDGDELYLSVEQILNSGEPGALNIEPTPVEPEVRMADLEKATKLIVSFSTDLQQSSANRIHNVVLSLQKINGLRINPGEVFSFNGSVGPRTQAAGFLPAPVIMPDKSMKDDWGGGVCQASSTVFNTAALAGMEMVERYHHSFPVSYLPAGMDATVVYGGADFKFRNSNSTPVFFHTYRKGNRVYVDLYGEPVPNGGSYKLVTDLIETVNAPEPQRILDTEGKYVTTAGGQYQHVKSRTGYRINTYRVLYQNGKQVSSELLVKNYYRPIQGIIYYREGAAPTQEPDSTQDPAPTPDPEPTAEPDPGPEPDPTPDPQEPGQEEPGGEGGDA